MSEGKPLTFLSRRELLKLVPPSLAAWAFAPTIWTMATQVALAADGSPSSDEKKWPAEWIWEQIPLGSHRGPQVKNLFTYFRRTFDLSEGVDKALVQISADSRYKLYVNGHYVGRGPARCDPIWQYYDEYDVAHILRPGKNVVAALVHYYGDSTGWYLLGRPGFFFQCT